MICAGPEIQQLRPLKARDADQRGFHGTRITRISLQRDADAGDGRTSHVVSPHVARGTSHMTLVVKEIRRL